jgi:serine/threonine-protein kinase
MGEVFEAVRTGPGGFRRPVALKRLTPDAAIRGESIQRFLGEAAVLARLDHPNVIDVHEVIAGDGGYVIVMELLRGAPFGAVVRAAREGGGAGVSVGEVLAVADQALAGLAHVHAARGDDGRALGVIHRDVTPGNLFVTESGTVKLLDFGIAKLRESIDAPVTRAGEIHGTLELIAPEQARGEPPDVTTDLYQLAGCLYWALGGRYPHGSGTPVELIARAALGEPPKLGELRPGLDPAVIAVIERAMAVDRTARFPTADAMRAALASMLLPRHETEAALAARVRGVLSADKPAESAGEPAATGLGLASTDPAPADTAPAPSSTEAATRSERGPARAPPPAADAPPPTRVDAVPGRAPWIFAALSVVAAGGAIAYVATRDGGGAPPAAPRDASGSGSDVVVTVPPSDAGPTPNRAVLLEQTADRPLLGVGISADGTKLAVASGANIWQVPRDGGAPIPLPTKAFTYDVDFVGPAATMLATSQAPDSGRWETIVFGSGDRVRGGSERDLFAVAPDGATVVYASKYAIYLRRPGVSDSTKLVTLKSAEVVAALAWSPDGAKLAFIRWRDPSAGATIEQVAASGGATELIVHVRLPYREPRAFGWLDANRLAYSVNTPDGASIFLVDVATRADPVEIGREPGAVVIAGRAGGGAIAYLAGTPRGVLRIAGPAGAPAPRGTAATTALAGWTTDDRLVASILGDAPAAIDPSGAPAAWPGGAAGDRVETLAGGVAFAVRAEPTPGDALWMLGDAPRRLAGVDHDRGTTALRCAEDRAAPCVRTTLGRRGDLRYVRWDPGTGADGDEVARSSELPWAVDHAVSASGAIAIVSGTNEIDVFPGTPGGERTWYAVDGGVVIDRVAWAGADLIVTGRGWRGHPWVALRLGLTAGQRAPAAELVDESAIGILGVPRVAADGRIAIARTELDVRLILRTP